MNVLIHPLQGYDNEAFESETPVEKAIEQIKMAQSEKPPKPSDKLSLAMRIVLWTALVLAVLTIIAVVYKNF